MVGLQRVRGRVDEVSGGSDGRRSSESEVKLAAAGTNSRHRQLVRGGVG